MSNEKITVYDVIGASTDAGEWVNGEFEAIVQNAIAGQGKKPSKADLCDPDSPGIIIKASWFGGADFVRFSGSRCLFGGQGMKVKNYNGHPDLQMSTKSTVNVLVAAAAPASKSATGTAPTQPQTQARGVAPVLNKEDIEPHFHRTMKKIALLYLHSDQYVTDIELKRGMILDPAARQAAIASLFITAKDKGLLDNVPAIRPLDPATKYPVAYVPPKKEATDPEAAKKEAEEKARVASELAAQKARAEAAEHQRQQENLDEDVPF